MSNYPKKPVLKIKPPKNKPEGGTQYWGEFTYGPKMPWGCWWLTSEPTKLTEREGITVLDCQANEFVEGDDGIVAESTLSHDPCSRRFLVGCTQDGSIVWWHNIGPQRYDLKEKKFCETSIRVSDGNVYIKGYGWNVEPDVEISINIKTGEKIPPED